MPATRATFMTEWGHLRCRVALMAVLLLTSAAWLAACSPPAAPTPAAPPLPGTPMPTATERDAPEPASVPECLQDAWGCAVIPPGETVKIGMAGPMEGDFASVGRDVWQAGSLAVEQYGEYLGWRFELVVQDTGGDPLRGVAVAEDFAADPAVVAVAGHVFSGETQAALAVYEDAGIPLMSPSATGPDLTRLGSKVFNRAAFTDYAQGEYAAGYLYTTLGVRRLAVLHDGSSYGLGLAEIVGDAFRDQGGIVTSVNLVTSGDDLTRMLERVVGFNPQAIYYGGYDEAAIYAVNELGRLRREAATGTGEETPAAPTPSPYGLIFFGCGGTFGENFRRATGENGEGVYSTAVIPPESAARDAFDTLYLERYGQQPGTLSAYTWHGYDAVGALIFAVKRVAIVGSDGNLYVPRGALIRQVRGLAGYPGLTGELTCDEIGECATTGPRFYVIENGAWVPAS